MADDTRQEARKREDLSKEALTVDPSNKAFTGSQWQEDKPQTYKPPENANLMPGGTVHTAGGKVPEVTIWNALQVDRPIADLPKRPCVRDSLMTGIGAGFATGGVRFIFRGSVWTACSWSIGSFCASSLVMFQYCQYRRHAEREGMIRAVEILNQKEAERRARDKRKEQLREERRTAKDQEQDQQLEALKARSPGQKPWWKVW